MKWNLIRTKVLAALLACLVVGVGGILALTSYSFSRNSQALAVESVSGAQKLFTILEAREISKMTSVSEALVANPQVRDAFVARDRPRLLELTAPLYSKLKSEGITNWMFHTPEPDMAVFLRLHAPAKFGDRLDRFLDKEVVRTHAWLQAMSWPKPDSPSESSARLTMRTAASQDTSSLARNSANSFTP